MTTLRRMTAFGAASCATITLTIAAPRPAAAWYAAGHAVIAMMAYRQMKPATRTMVDDLLKQHPDYKNWLAELPAGMADDKRGEYIFAIASTWPDRIKDAKDETVSVKFYNLANRRQPVSKPYPTAPALYPDLDQHQGWHYDDVPINADGKDRLPPTDASIITAIPACRKGIAATVSSASYRAYYVAWLAHLVGDIHQPLHATGRFSAAHPDGDQGGNLVRLQVAGAAEKKNLHSYWDSLLGDGPDPTKYNTLANGWDALNATIDTITAESPRLLAGYSPQTQNNLDENRWLNESFTVAQETVYDFGTNGPDAPEGGDLPQPDALYHANAVRIAHQRAALAAHRLALALDACVTPTAP